MDILKLFNIKKSILHLKTLYNGHLAIIDAQNALRIVDPASYEVIGGFKTSLTHTRQLGSHVDVSNDGSYSVSVIPESDKAALFNVHDKQLLFKIGHHQGEVESVAIDSLNRYCATGGQDGKTFVWVLKTGRLAFTMPPHTDFVTAIAFHDQWIATGSYDRMIHVMNMATMKQQFKLVGHSSVIVKLIFLPESRLVSIDKEGGMVLWNMRSGKIIKRLTRMNDEVTTMTASRDGRFIFVGTKLGYVGLYDMESLEQVKYRYIKENESISALAFMDHPYRLAIGTSEGNVRIYSLFGDEKGTMQLLRDRQYKRFYEMLDENPMLLYSKGYEAAERIWNDVLNKARVCLEKEEKTKAKELLDLFAGVPSKTALIQQIYRAYEKYGLFQNYAQEGRFPLAYSLAKQFPPFQESEPYHKMEQRWKKLFAKAQELILTPTGEEQARQLLAPYRGISEKTALIQQLFEQRKMYEFFKKVIAQRDFVKFFELVKLHPFLKEFNEYNIVMDYASKLYIQAHKGYMEGDYSTAKKACEVLVAFPDYAAEAQEMNDTIRVKHLLHDAIVSNNLVNAFAYLSAYPLLYDTKEAQSLERQWDAIVDQAQRYAAKGDALHTLDVFEPYRTIRDKYVAMATVAAQAYCAQLEQKLRNNVSQDVMERGIRKYVEIFGIEEGILQVVDDFKKRHSSKLDPQTLKQGSFDTWTPALRIDDITAS